MANPFKGTADAEISTRGTYLEPNGRFLLEVKKTVFKTTRKSGDAFIVEFEILESDLPVEHPVGSPATWFQGMRDKTVALPAIKEFMLYLCQAFNAEEQTKKDFLSTLDQTLNDACEEETLFAGYKIRCKTESHVTQKGGDFTRHIWTEYEGEQPEG
jgi:hypothetical protein